MIVHIELQRIIKMLEARILNVYDEDVYKALHALHTVKQYMADDAEASQLLQKNTDKSKKVKGKGNDKKT